MKTKRRNFGSFFVRVGTSFLAFWLVFYKRIYNFTYNFSTFYGRCTYLY